MGTSPTDVSSPIGMIDTEARQISTTCGSVWDILRPHTRGIILAIVSIILSAAALGQTVPGDWPQTEARLIALLSSNSEQKRTALAEIRGLRSERASRLAVPALRDSDEIVRATAAAAVVFLPKHEAETALLPLLGDKQAFARREAAHALGRVGGPAAVQRLISAMNTDRDREVRSAAAVALGKIADVAALDSLLSILGKRPTEDDEFLRRSAARSIGQIFDVMHGGDTYTVTPQNYLPPKFKKLDSSVSTQRSGNTTAVISTLSQILQSAKEADDTRREAAFALGAVREDAAAAVLRNFLNSPDPYLSEISKEALLKIEHQE